MTIASLADRIQHIRHRISRAAERSGRKADAIRLVTVTKNISVEGINEAIENNCFDLGENRVQEALEKRPKLKAPSGTSVVHHFLGSLQTNKARKAVENFDLIQSIDRPKLALFLDRVAAEIGKTQDCLIEVKMSSEKTKMGLPMKEAETFIHTFGEYKNLRLKGLMTIAPYEVRVDQTREIFRRFKEFFEKNQPYLGDAPILSMGMTDDFEIAIEEGSNMVRIGRAIFGERRI